MKPSPLAARLMRLGSLSANDLRYLQALELRSQSYPRATHLLEEGATRSARCFAMAEGWCASEMHLPDGRMQIIDFALPGDVMGLTGVVLDEQATTVVALSPVRVTPIGREAMTDMRKNHAELYCAILVLGLAQTKTLAGRLVNVGQRKPLARVAYCMHETFHRLQAAELIMNGNSYRCPATQSHIAHLLGLSTVHVNRVLKMLHERGIASLKKGIVTIWDQDALMEISDSSAPPLGWAQKDQRIFGCG